jgi:hypothetical protein
MQTIAVAMPISPFFWQLGTNMYKISKNRPTFIPKKPNVTKAWQVAYQSETKQK